MPIPVTGVPGNVGSPHCRDRRVYTAARLGLAAGITDDVATVTGRPPRDFRAFARDTSPQSRELR